MRSFLENEKFEIEFKKNVSFLSNELERRICSTCYSKKRIRLESLNDFHSSSRVEDHRCCKPKVKMKKKRFDTSGSKACARARLFLSVNRYSCVISFFLHHRTLKTMCKCVCVGISSKRTSVQIDLPSKQNENFDDSQIETNASLIRTEFLLFFFVDQLLIDTNRHWSCFYLEHSSSSLLTNEFNRQRFLNWLIWVLIIGTRYSPFFPAHRKIR